ncbi:MAG: DUF4159 domain-containing protein [Phycisphaerae bacterium]|nr:DUF4159 domain-containing protein [Phycisphaerae bacterium]
MRIIRGYSLVLLVSAALLWAPTATAQRNRKARGKEPIPFSGKAVDRAIENAKKYLWSQYQDKEGRWRSSGGYPGGYTALAAYALLSAGESPQKAEMKRALEWLEKVKMVKTYSLGLRAQVWAALPTAQGRKLLAKDARQLCNSICRKKDKDKDKKVRGPLSWYGTHGYVSNGKARPGGDNSNTQFGILGVWAAARQNVEIPKSREYWELVYKHWRKTQNADGGWGYNPHNVSKATMTAAGLASMFVAFDNIHADCDVNTEDDTLEKALTWFEKNFDKAIRPTHNYYGYYLYGVERVGLACGYKYFGHKNWYKLGATSLLNSQQADGAWKRNLVDTSFALLFLTRGRNPVLFNRLKYDGDWNNRSRALANLTRWISRKFERKVNWQIINLKVPVAEWHDAPILLITGSKKPNFSDEAIGKLRKFVHQGGMILSVAEYSDKNSAFDEGMREYYSKIFPRYKMVKLPPDHPIHNAHFKPKQKVELEGISNGVRLLAVHTTEDLHLPWQKNEHADENKIYAFQAAANLFFFATDHGSLRNRGTTHWPKETPFKSMRTINVARIKYNGNWDPEPLAWERFRLLMGGKWRMKLTVRTVTPEQLQASEYPVAVMTGTTEIMFTDVQKRALKAYIAAGGTVIMDAAGGSKIFAGSATDLASELTGELSGGDGRLCRLPMFSPVYQIKGLKIASVRYRRAAKSRISSLTHPRIRVAIIKGRPAVFVSADDLTTGLVGVPCFTCIGYTPGTSVELMRNMVLYAAGVRKYPASAPISRPTTQPAS